MLPRAHPFSINALVYKWPSQLFSPSSAIIHQLLEHGSNLKIGHLGKNDIWFIDCSDEKIDYDFMGFLDHIKDYSKKET